MKIADDKITSLLLGGVESATLKDSLEKKIKSGRTIASIEQLDKESRVEELSRMLGGQNKSSHALAETLLNSL